MTTGLPGVTLALSILSKTPPCEPDVCALAAGIEARGKSAAEKRRLHDLGRELLGALAVLKGDRDAFLRDANRSMCSRTLTTT